MVIGEAEGGQINSSGNKIKKSFVVAFSNNGRSTFSIELKRSSLVHVCFVESVTRFDRRKAIDDKIGYDLIKPEAEWQERPDMKYTKRLRASIVPRARFVEDIVKLADEMGLKEIQTVSTKDMIEKYFKERTDNLVSASGEFFLVAKT